MRIAAIILGLVAASAMASASGITLTASGTTTSGSGIYSSGMPFNATVDYDSTFGFSSTGTGYKWTIGQMIVNCNGSTVISSGGGDAFFNTSTKKLRFFWEFTANDPGRFVNDYVDINYSNVNLGSTAKTPTAAQLSSALSGATGTLDAGEIEETRDTETGDIISSTNNTIQGPISLSTVSPVPEPGTMCVFAIGAVGMLRQRKSKKA